MNTNTKDISFYLYAEILMNKLQGIGDSVEPYTTRAKDENDVQQDIIRVQQEIQAMTQDATTQNGVDKKTADDFAKDVDQLGKDAKNLAAFEAANPTLNDGLGAQAMSAYTMITGTGGPNDPNNSAGIGNIGEDILKALNGDDTDLMNDLNKLATYYYSQKFPSSPPPAGAPPADLGPLDDWVNNGYNGGVSTSALDTNLGAAVNTNNNQLNTWSTLIQQLDQVAQNVISSLSSLWGTEVSNTSPSLTSA
ncbi:MAG TPA: hypothetical protein VIJ14_08670 [Rhabdochlamydiaceae bacterium]